MSRMILSLVSVASLVLTVHADIVAARAAFEKEYAGPFAKTSLRLPSAAPAEDDIFRVTGNASFRLVMPYADDRRLKFAEISVGAGKFVSGQLFVLGFKPKAINQDAFRELLATTPMISVRIDRSAKSAVSVAYAPKALWPSHKVVIPPNGDLRINPLGRLLGCLEQPAGRIGIDLKDLKVQVEAKGTDGRDFSVGTFADNKMISGEAVIDAVRSELERRDPRRKGQVSDRDVIDYWNGSTICYKPIADERAGDVGK